MRFHEQRRTSAKRSKQELRIQALNILGGKCVVCGITDPRILNINHKTGDGHEERLALGRDQRAFYLKVLLDENRQLRYDVRCYNHNILFEYEILRRKWNYTGQEPVGQTPESWHMWYQIKRVRLLEFLGGKCVICGITDMRILTVNHLKGGGIQAFKSASSVNAYYTLILDGVLPKEDFDVRCMNHNILYEYEVGRKTWLEKITQQ